MKPEKSATGVLLTAMLCVAWCAGVASPAAAQPKKEDVIRVTADHLAIMDGRVEAVSVPLARVRSLTLQRRFTAERPPLEALLGLACLFLGVVAMRSAVLWMFGSRYVSRSLILLALLLPLGGWLVRDGLQRGFTCWPSLTMGTENFPSLGSSAVTLRR